MRLRRGALNARRPVGLANTDVFDLPPEFSASNVRPGDMGDNTVVVCTGPERVADIRQSAMGWA